MTDTGTAGPDGAAPRDGTETSSRLIEAVRSDGATGFDRELGFDFESVSNTVDDALSFDAIATTTANRTVAIEAVGGEQRWDRTLASASKLDPDFLVLVGAAFDDDHVALLRWLNEATHADLFAVSFDVSEGDDADRGSAVRPDVLVEPSGWSTRSERSLTEKQLLQLRYWAELRDRIEGRTTRLESCEPQPNNWYNNSMSEIGYKLQFAINSYTSVLLTQLVVRDDPDGFQALADDRDAIERDIGEDLIWLSPDEAKGEGNRARITLRRDGDLFAEGSWSEYQTWMVDAGERFYDVFHERIRGL
ncbi:DUF4268 domain-containing protein [Haladaptatus sp. T7]|uniref:DUF4268 domain-containing protein n=1 Tax=Haladaptatus sp. T7 TaxID=2029368 RepID=UPI0021A25691|nr:DUF4268 domain-containing protein [Haladaptatus sp. T7]GKZ12388.1 hypothetical protein HAL_02690 [Haladaptatus sp. T7]